VNIDLSVELQDICGEWIHRRNTATKGLLEKLAIPGNTVDKFVETVRDALSHSDRLFRVGVRQQGNRSTFKVGAGRIIDLLSLNLNPMGAGIRVGMRGQGIEWKHKGRHGFPGNCGCCSFGAWTTQGNDRTVMQIDKSG
jgi:hypothetical protein